MPKRKHSRMSSGPVDGFGAPTSQIPQGWVALPFTPGQFETVYVPAAIKAAANNRPSIFTTISKLPIFVDNLTALYNATRRIFDKFTCQQQIRAEPVNRVDGARKKILIDAGFAEATPASSTDTPEHNSIWPELWLNTPYQDNANWLEQASDNASPNATPVKPKHTLESPAAAAITTPELTQAYAISTPVAAIDLDPLTPPSLTASDIEFYDRQQLLTPPSMTQSDIDFFDRQQPLTPPSLRASDTDLLDGEPPAHSTPFPPVHTPRPSRIVTLKVRFGDHFSPLRKSTNDDLPLENDYAKPADFKNKSAKTSLKIHEVKDRYKARRRVEALRDAEIRAQQQQEQQYDEEVATQIIREYNERNKKPLFPIMVYEEDMVSYDTNDDTQLNKDESEMPTTSEYDNDMSLLPDAPTPPPRKACRWEKQSRAKPFYRDILVDEMLDSTLEVIKSSPQKEIQEGEVTEMSFSLETLLEYKKIALFSPVVQQAPPPLPTKLPTITIQKPLVQPLQQEEKKKLSEAIQLTNNGNIEMHLIQGKLTTYDFKTLLPENFNGSPRAWLNDNIVNEYLSLLVEHEKAAAGYEHRRGGPAPPVHAFLSQWYTSASSNLKSVERWAGKKQLGGKNLLDSHLLLFPVCDGGHWRLVAIKPQDRTIEYLDSLDLDGSDILDTTIGWLKQELGGLYREQEWTILKKQRSVRQKNGSDCGVFACLNALALLRGKDPALVNATDGMKDARRRMATSLLQYSVTKEF